MTDRLILKPGTIVRTKEHPGIAFFVSRNQGSGEYEEDEDGEEIPLDEDRIAIVMVGDDHRWIVDKDSVSLLDDEDFCHACGQIGCGHAA